MEVGCQVEMIITLLFIIITRSCATITAASATTTCRTILFTCACRRAITTCTCTLGILRCRGSIGIISSSIALRFGRATGRFTSETITIGGYAATYG